MLALGRALGVFGQVDDAHLGQRLGGGLLSPPLHPMLYVLTPLLLLFWRKAFCVWKSKARKECDHLRATFADARHWWSVGHHFPVRRSGFQGNTGTVVAGTPGWGRGQKPPC